MDTLLHIIASAIAGFILGYALKYFGPKANVVYWSPHSFLFQLDTGQIFTHAITIQNMGHSPASNIEIAHRAKPELFKLQPSLDFAEVSTPDGQHIIRVSAMAPGEFFSIEFLSSRRIPELLYIRSDHGHCPLIPIQQQRAIPRWWIWILQGFMLIGLGFSVYWLARSIMVVSSLF